MPMSATAVLDLLDRSRESLIDAQHEPVTDRRYQIAHLAALRAGAAILAARARPRGRQIRGTVTVWELIPSLRLSCPSGRRCSIGALPAGASGSRLARPMIWSGTPSASSSWLPARSSGES